jgi:hypothetical protein
VDEAWSLWRGRCADRWEGRGGPARDAPAPAGERRRASAACRAGHDGAPSDAIVARDAVMLLAPCQAHEPADRRRVDRLIAKGFRTLKVRVGYGGRTTCGAWRTSSERQGARVARLDANRGFSEVMAVRITLIRRHRTLRTPRDAGMGRTPRSRPYPPSVMTSRSTASRTSSGQRESEVSGTSSSS